MGSLSVLNVGAGDIQISFNRHDSAERERAIRMLKDMQQRGYAILVRLEDGTYTRAVAIDAEHGAYIIQDPAEGTAPATVAEGEVLDETSTALVRREPARKTRGRRGRPRRSVPIERAHAVGVARSAGG